MAYNIVKHRRGTTQEWEEFDLIPEDGELVIEECSDGTRKCKIGTGDAPFSKLPYLDEEALQLVTKVENLTKDVEKLDESVINLVQPSVDSLDAKYSKKLDEIVKQHTDDVEAISRIIDNKAEELTTTFEGLLENQALASGTLLTNKAETLVADYTSKITDSEKRLQSQLDTLTKDHSDDITKIGESIVTTAGEVESRTDTKISASISASEARTDVIITELRNNLSQINNTLEQLKQFGDSNNSNLGVSIPNDLVTQLKDLQTRADQLNAQDTSLLNLLYEANTKITNLTITLEAAKQQHNTISEATSTTIANLDARLSKADTDLATILTDNINRVNAEILDLNEDQTILLNQIYAVNSTLGTRINNVQKILEGSISASANALTEDLDATKTLLDDNITTAKNELTSNLDKAKKELSTDIKNFSENLKIQIDTNKKAIDRLSSTTREDLIETSSKIANIETMVAANKAATDLNKDSIRQAVVNTEAKIQRVNTNLSTLDNRIDAQAARISNIIAGSPTEESELSDIRIGYDGNQHGSAGDAVRAVGDDLIALRDSLSQYIDTQAIDGLRYDTTGEVGKKQPYTLYLTADGNVLEDSGVQIISGSGSGGDSTSRSTLKINYITTSPVVVPPTSKDEVLLKFTFSGTDSSGDAILQANATWKVNGNTVAYGVVNDGANEFDVAKYLTPGTSKVLLEVSDDSGAGTTKSWSVQLIDLRVVSGFDDTRSYSVDEDIIFTYTPYGAIKKTAIFELDGDVIGRVEIPAITSGSPLKYTISKQRHGAHLLKVYLEDPDNPDIFSEPIVKDLLFLDPNSDLPIIGSATASFTIEQYDTAKIVYTVYDPKKPEAPTVFISVDDGPSSELVLKPNSDYNNTPTGIFAYRGAELGTHTIKITCGTQVKVITVNVEELLNITISPETAGLVFDFDPTGKSNNDINGREWVYNGIRMSIPSNFDWTNGGYIPDSPDGPCFCIKAGSSVNIDYNLFGDEAKNSGKDFKMIFKTQNVANPEAVFLSCLDGDATSSIGLKMGVQNAYVYGKNGSLELSYSEDDIVEFEFNIASATDKIAMVAGYEDGVMSRPWVYDEPENVSFKQRNPQYITLGSKHCDLYIYRLKFYNTSLSDADILKNFIADARTVAEMKARYRRNQIYDENHVLTPEVLAEKCPDLRIYKVSAPRFTTSKSDKVANTTIQQIYKGGDKILDNWTCYGAKHSGQGTSSDNYGLAGRNLDFIMNTERSYFKLGDGTTTDKITLTRTSVPVAYLNAKVNIASSNNLTNALLASRYNKFNPYRRSFVDREGVNTDYIKDTMEFHNCVIFIQETDPDLTTHKEFADTDYHFYAIGNIGDSKKTDNTRLTDPEDKYECCVEIMDIGKALSDFPTDTKINAMSYKEDPNTFEKTYTWAKDENRGILYERTYTITQDTEINLNKTYYIDLPEKVAAKSEQLTPENLKNLYERVYTLTEDTKVETGKVYYLDNNGTRATKDYLDDISNPKEAGLYEWRRDFRKTTDTEIVQGKPYYIETLVKTNAMSYTIEEVPDYLWAKNENLNMLYELINGEYVKTQDKEIDLSKTYYYSIEEKDTDGNVIDTKYFNAMGYTTKQIKVYTYAKNENLDKLYEVTYYTTPDTTIDLSNTYYVDILEQDDFSEAYTYGWRYLWEDGTDEENEEVFRYCKQKWIDFYRFITTSTDEYFKEHFDDYFVKDSALYYYLFTTRYCMVDNRAKNSFWHYGKTGEYDTEGNPVRKWDLCWDYDNDTALGLNNFGSQVYRYGLEDTDRDEDGEEIFRESDSTFFCRIRDLFSTELKQLYINLESRDAWNAEKFISECDEWQAEFPEELWRLDIERKYLRTFSKDPQFLSNMCNGRMKYHRRQWERNQEQYMASKYQTPSSLDTSKTAANFRVNEPSASFVKNPNYSFTLTPYSYMYLNVDYGYGSLGGKGIKSARGTPGIPVTITAPQDLTPDIINIGSAKGIMDFGDLSKFYFKTVSIQNAPRVKTLKLGNTDDTYNNRLDTFSTGENPLLEILNIENVSFNEKNLILSLSELINLKELYAFGTNITSVTFALGGKIEKAELPALNDITLKQLPYLTLENFKMTKYHKVSDLTVEECSQLNQKLLLERCLKQNGGNLARARLIGIDFGTVEYNYFNDYIFGLHGISANGEDVPNAILKGSATFEVLSGEQFNNLKDRYPDLQINYGTLNNVVTFKSTAGSESILCEYPVTCVNSTPADCLNPVGDKIVTPLKEADAAFEYRFLGWSTAADTLISSNDYDNNPKEFDTAYTVNSLKAIEGDRVLYPVFIATRKSYDVKFINPTAPENQQILAVVPTLYGGTATYPGEDPIKLDTASPELYPFTGWYPSPANITGPLTCLAQFTFEDKWYTLGLNDISYSLKPDTTSIAITDYLIDTSANKAIKVPESFTVDSIEYNVTELSGFRGHTNISLVSLPDTLTKLGNDAFRECSKLEDINLPDNITSLGEYCFNYSGIKAIIIPSGITVLPGNAFSNCSQLSQVVLPSNLKRIENTCFSWCSRLRNITLPSSLVRISTYGFNSCALETVRIPASVDGMYDHAFGSMESLQEVTFENRSTIPDIACIPSYGAFTGSGTVNTPIVFNVPWSEADHNKKFTGTDEKGNAKDPTLGAVNCRFIFNYYSDNPEIVVYKGGVKEVNNV